MISHAAETARAFLGPMPGRREIEAVCRVALAAAVVLTALSIALGSAGRLFLGHAPGGDFAQFYVAGKILNEYSGARVYDVLLESKLQAGVRPTDNPNVALVYANAPFIALLCRPLACLPYLWAYAVFLLLISALYVSGLWLIWPAGEGFRKVSRTALLVSLSFAPFAFECWFGGQLSVLAFFFLALLVRCERANLRVAAGASLAACIYKPTLLVLAVPMLLVGRRFRELAGFLAGTSALAGVSLLAVGQEGCVGYLRTLMMYGHFSLGADSPLQFQKYVDIRTFFRLLFGSHSYLGGVAALAFAAVAIFRLSKAWARSGGYPRPAQELLLAATMSWTLVWNLYVPLYDTVLAVIGALLTAGVLYRSADGQEGNPSIRSFHIMVLLLYTGAWLTQPLASAFRIQVFTVLLAGFGWVQLTWAHRAAQGVQSVECPGHTGRAGAA